MRPAALIFTAFLVAGAAAPARAADLTVLSPGTMLRGLRTLAAEWTAQTGNKVSFSGGTVGHVKDLAAGVDPGDLVVLPDAELDGIAARLKPGTRRPLGLALLGLAMKAGQPRPDISTLAKFIAVLEKSGITYSDPSGGSASAGRVAAMLTRPDFAAVKGVVSQGPSIKAVAAGAAVYSGGVVSEEMGIPGVEVAGEFPRALGLDIDYGAALLGKAAAPAEAAAFLRYVSRPEARAVWKASGVDPH